MQEELEKFAKVWQVYDTLNLPEKVRLMNWLADLLKEEIERNNLQLIGGATAPKDSPLKTETT